MSTPSIFSFNGRIQRVDYLLTTAVVIDLLLVINRSSDTAKIPSLLMLPVAIVLGWLGLAAAVKRCHDLGQSGFYVLIPLYGLWLIFPDGTPGENEYGPNQKEGPHAVRDASGFPLAMAILILSLGFWLKLAVSE
jgi:uncharacterized membrane protein YhaH (DUF805 family)